MEENREREERESGNLFAGDLVGREAGPEDPPGRSSPTWRWLVLAVIAAAILSVAATLLLGRPFAPVRATQARGCGPQSACCPPAVDQARAAR